MPAFDYLHGARSNFERFPYTQVDSAPNDSVFVGWRVICGRLLRHAATPEPGTSFVIAFDCYQGVFIDETIEILKRELSPAVVYDTRSLFKDEAAVRRMVGPELTDDPVFGYLTRLTIDDFFDPDVVAQVRSRIAGSTGGIALVFGPGAQFVVEKPDVFVYVDMPRWEIQKRQRAHKIGSLGLQNKTASSAALYKQSFFVDWRVLDRWKLKALPSSDYVLTCADHARPKMVPTTVFFEALARIVSGPFQMVPFFDAGVWGGQWLRQVCDVTDSSPNFAWCFNCVPEEQSLSIGFGSERLEFPALDLVLFRTRELLGDPVHARFGKEFPIRFDFLDTMEGQSLSLQVHPLTEYIQEHFGMHYTQDESYYILDATPQGKVYLGLKEGVSSHAVETALRQTDNGRGDFRADTYVQSWPAYKHDHFLIPAGTPHCSGAGTLVLEISATPYIFTFKLWDWNRMGLDGKPRPIHLTHGLSNIDYGRTTRWVEKNLVNRVREISDADGTTEEQTGLHEREFIETRRHWFSHKVNHDTGGTEAGSVHVLNLIEGREALIESPTDAFQPFVLHYAETVVIPAAVGAYTARPYGEAEGKRCATIQASVRH